MTHHQLPAWLCSMRRDDREITDREEIWEIVRSAEICHLGLCSEGWPYVIPLNYGVVGEALYFHCAAEGTKLELMRANPNACFQIEANVEMIPNDMACGWSVRYVSVVGFGGLSLVEDDEEKLKAIAALIGQYTDREVELPERVSANTLVLRLDVQSMTGKRSMGS